ncbi:MAG: hypothetical protein KJ681_13445 [Gammaproteobacteria bacterium]|nr:hypothetical protein [Gammaproteobacteria bacterium]
MESKPSHPRYPANWGVRFLCDCKEQGETINLHNGVAQEISTHGVRILSDHHICQKKKVAMHLMIPSRLNDAPMKVVKIIGHNIEAILKDGKYLCEIEFMHFEENGLKVLEKNLNMFFGPRDYPQIAQSA